jgi:site-specific DNA-methyltransferase (adenine-specific)
MPPCLYINEIACIDCLDGMELIGDGVVDMVLCDLPYGTTQNKWDSIIPLERLWEQYCRILKHDRAVVLTATQPFTSALVMSKLHWFRYDWTWKKPKGTGHLNAKKQPMRDKEDILVFSSGACPYNPQFQIGKPFKNKRGRNTSSYGSHGEMNYENEGRRYPKQVLEFDVVGRGTLHPTQKPVALFEYLIRTYTNPGDLVLDNCIGSGTTAIACLRSGRDFIGMEKDAGYVEVANKRIEEEKERLASIKRKENDL